MNYQWFFENVKGELTKEVAQKIYDVYIDGFNLSANSSWGIAGIQKAYRNSSILGLLKDKNDNIFGYTFYVVPPEPFEGEFLLWNNATCLKKVCQGKGYYGTKIFQEIANFFPNKRFGWAGGRSQNPKIYLRYKRIGKCYPFDEIYGDTKQGKALMKYLRTYISEAKDVSQLDLSTGVASNVYEAGELGDFRLNLNLNGAKDLETKLDQWGLNRSNGDTLLVVSKINTKLPLKILPEIFNVYSFSNETPIDINWFASTIFSFSKTEDETTLITTSKITEYSKKDVGLKALKVDCDVSSISGVLSSIVKPLGEAGITVYAFSTFETDYVLVKKDALNNALKVLENSFTIKNDSYEK